MAERLRGALGPLGFEVHAFKVLASRAVTSPAVTSGGVTSLCPEVGGNAGRWRCPEPAVTPAAAEGSGAGPSAPGEGRPFASPGWVGSGRVGGRRHGRPVPASRLRRQDEPPCSARGRRQAALPPRPPCSVLRSASPRRPSSGMKPPGCERLRGRRRPPHHHLPSPAGRQAPLRRGRRTGRPLPRGSGELPSARRGPGAAVRGLGSAPEEPSCAAASAGG